MREFNNTKAYYSGSKTRGRRAGVSLTGINAYTVVRVMSKECSTLNDPLSGDKEVKVSASGTAFPFQRRQGELPALTQDLMQYIPSGSRSNYMFIVREITSYITQRIHRG